MVLTETPTTERGKTMQRHAKKLQTKSRTHAVTLDGHGWTVTSGSSGKQYSVTELADGRFHCTCDWHYYHPYGECSHTAAVRDWIAKAGGRTVYLKDSVESYRRSHQRYEDYNQGIIYTSA